MTPRPVALHKVLILPFIILITLAVLVTSYFTWKFNVKTTSVLGDKISEQSALRIKEQLEFHFSQAQSYNLSLVEPIEYDFIDIQNHDEVLDYITYVVSQDANIDTLSFAYPDGAYMGVGNTPQGHILKKYASVETDRMFYTVDLDTDEVIQQRANYDARTRPWFKEAKAHHKPTWSSVFTTFSTGKLAITYTEALYDETDEFVGVVGTDVELSNLNAELDRIRLTDNSYLFILDNDEHVIAQSDLDEHHGGEVLYHYNKSDNELLKQSVDLLLAQNDFDTAPIHTDARFDINGVSEDYYVNSIPYHYAQGLDWHIGVIIPKSDFLGSIEKLRANTFIIWLVSFILSVLLGLMLTYLINKAINRLHGKLDEIENTGSMYEHDNSHTIREISDLSMAFSKMSRRLHESYLDIQKNNQALEAIVAKRSNILKEANKQLKNESNIDPLTKLHNRRSFDYFMQYYWDSFESNEIKSLSLVICAIDCFDQYVESYDRRTAEGCVIKVSNIIKQSAKESDFIACYDEGEFAIIMPDSSADDAIKVAKRIIDDLKQQGITHQSSEAADIVSVSIGIASTSCEAMQIKHELINRADIALHFAKEEGMNRYVVYHDHHDKPVHKYVVK